MTSFWNASRYHSVSLDQHFGGFVTLDQPQSQRPCCLVLLRGQCLVHCFSYCTWSILSESARSWTSPSKGHWLCWRFTDLRSLFRPWNTATQRSNHPLDRLQWMHSNRLKLKDQVHLAGISLSSCHLFLQLDRHQWRSCYLQFAIWASSSIRPPISLTMSPGWQGLAISRFDSYGRFEDHWPLSPAMPCACNGPIRLLQWSTWRRPKEPTWPALWRHEERLLHDLSWCYISRSTWPAPFVGDCTGLICRHEFNLSSVASHSDICTVSAPPYLVGYFNPVSSIEGCS